jgi:lipid-A-disaccharide synthase-like uncharacterized protein
MSTSLWLIVGFLGQALFSARFIIQWLASEKQKKSIIPIEFWYFSLAGSMVLLAYALSRKDPVFVLGQSFGVLIYLRNLHFINPGLTKKLIFLVSFYLLAVLAYFYSVGLINPQQMQQLRSNNTLTDSIWQVVGFIGQVMFSSRFILQWMASEKSKESVMPVAFWYFSIFGSIALLAYAIYQKDPVFIVGQSFGMFVYLRNLYFIFNGRK